MVDVQLTEVSLRDGNQSLWGATGLRTEHIVAIAPVLNRVGFRALDFMSSTAMGVAVRTHREDPWQRIRLTRAAVPDAHLQFIGTGLRFISWERAHPDVLRLVYERLVAAGISRFVVLDPTHDMDAVRQTARTIRQAGGTEIIMALTYTISAVHDDAFYAGIAGQAAASPYIDRAYIKDPAGLLTPERARTLIPAVRARLGGKPLELHAHCTIGLSPLVYLTAPDLGVEVLQTGCGALADGSSLPDAERVVANLREFGHTVDVDDRLLARAARYFDRLAAAESLPSGQPRPYDAAFTRHQLAGGVLTTLRRQLAELGLEAKFGAVMEEVSRVRAELGYPIMVTPFPQMVMGQALSNVLGNERYGVVPDQVIRYVLGSFGKPTAPVEPWVLDKILDRPRARELAAEPPPLSVTELRRRLPHGISDEELLLRFAMPAGEVDAMLAAAPAARHYNPEMQPVLRLLCELGTRPPVRRLVVDKPGFRLSLSRSSGEPGSCLATWSGSGWRRRAGSCSTWTARWCSATGITTGCGRCQARWRSPAGPRGLVSRVQHVRAGGGLPGGLGRGRAVQLLADPVLRGGRRPGAGHLPGHLGDDQVADRLRAAGGGQAVDRRAAQRGGPAGRADGTAGRGRRRS